jgi:VWFA-related protein
MRATLLVLALVVAGGCWEQSRGQGPVPTAHVVPKAARAAFDKAQDAMKSQKIDEARAGFERAVQLDPGFAEAWFQLGQMQKLQKQSDAARQSFEAAMRADPNYLPPYVQLAGLLWATEDWVHAVEVTDRIIALNPTDYPVAYLTNGVAHYNLGQKDRSHLAPAEESLRRAEQLDAAHRSPLSWVMLGKLLADREDWAGAAQQWQVFLKYAPNDPSASTVRTLLSEVEKWMGTPAANAVFRTESELALVHFQVKPKSGQLIQDLRPEDIEILEDGISQKVAVFEGGRLYPRKLGVEITLLFDCSGSIRQAHSLNPHVFQKDLLEEYENANIAIYAFSTALHRDTSPTRDPQTLQHAMDLVLDTPTGDTPLFEAILDTMRQSPAKPGVLRSLVVLSDGQSTRPGDLANIPEVLRFAQDNGVSIYPVLLTNTSSRTDTPEAEQRGGPPRIVGTPVRRTRGLAPLPGPPLAAGTSRMESIKHYISLAQATGGQEFQTTVSDELLPEILRVQAERMRFDYVVGYYPSSATDKPAGTATEHSVQVILRAKDRGTILGGTRLVVH